MYCENCGKQIPDSSQFCDNCGAKLNQQNNTAETSATENNSGQYYSANPNPTPQPTFNNYYAAPQNTGDVVTAGGYIWRNIVMGLVALIPVVGFIVNIILLCVWMGDTTKQESFRNWAKATLILTIIGIVLSIVVTIIAVIAGVAIGSSFAEYASSGYGYY